MDTPRPAPARLADRLFDVDWLRLIAIGLVFASHTGRLFDTMEPWHFKNPIRTDAFTIPMRALLRHLLAVSASRLLRPVWREWLL